MQAQIMAELHRGRVSAVLAANAQLDIRASLLTQFHSHLHQAAHAVLVQMGEGIELIDLLVVIGVQELACVVPAEAEGHLRQIVGTEGEELGLPGNLVCGEGRSGNLDHRTHFIVHVGAGFGNQPVGRLNHHILDILQFLDLAHQGNHNLRNDVILRMLLHHIQRSGNDRRGLHGGNLRIGHSQAAAPVAHHGVKLMERSDDILQLLCGDLQLPGNFRNVLLLAGQELMQGGIQEADGHRTACQLLVHRLKVTLLIGQNLSQSSFVGLLAMRPTATSSFIPRFKMVSSIPDMRARAPEQTETSSGLLGSPNFFSKELVRSPKKRPAKYFASMANRCPIKNSAQVKQT